MAKSNMSNSLEKFKGRGALDAFLNLLTLITSGWLAWSLGAMVFQLVNKHFGTMLIGTSYFNEGLLKTGIASALIIGPVYFFVMFVLHRKYKTGELNHKSGVHRWLTYLMLLISALSIIGSLIALISGFLNGDYTANIILKIITIIAIAGCIFGYYFYDLKRDDYSSRSLVSLITGSIVAAVLIIFVVLGFFNVTNPATARLQKIDFQTISAINNVYSMIVGNYQTSGSLEQVLDLAPLLSSSAPDAYKAVTYRLIDKEQFELCGEFLAQAAVSDYSYSGDIIWGNHKAGKVCHTYNIKTELQKNYGILEKAMPSTVNQPATTNTTMQ